MAALNGLRQCLQKILLYYKNSIKYTGCVRQINEESLV